MTAAASHFTVKMLQPGDCAGFLAIAEQVDALHYQGLPHLMKPPEEAKRTEAEFLSMLGQPDTWLFGVDHEDALIGLIKVRLLTRPEDVAHHPSRTMIVDALAVEEGWQRRGIGRLLMEHAMDWARSHDAQSIELRVFEFNTDAIAFYESMGLRTLTRNLSLRL